MRRGKAQIEVRIVVRKECLVRGQHAVVSTGPTSVLPEPREIPHRIRRDNKPMVVRSRLVVRARHVSVGQRRAHRVLQR